jgi:hypothetical protein
MEIVNWDETHVNIVRYLGERREPIHYRTLHDIVGLVYLPNRRYGPRTSSAAEKLRQYYAEGDQPDVVAFSGGYIGLRRWFANSYQLQLLQPADKVTIRGSCILSYEAGYEVARREPHMKDHFADAASPYRQERRRRAYLVEAHVRDFFRTNYAEFYVPPSNENKYAMWASEDFFLKLPQGTLSVDVKSWSGKDDDGDARGYIRQPNPKVVYVWADWCDDNTTIINGMQPGGLAATFGEATDNGLVKVNGKQVQSIDRLLVMLNMARVRLDYGRFMAEYRSRRQGEAA